MRKLLLGTLVALATVPTLYLSEVKANEEAVNSVTVGAYTISYDPGEADDVRGKLGKETAKKLLKAARDLKNQEKKARKRSVNRRAFAYRGYNDFYQASNFDYDYPDYGVDYGIPVSKSNNNVLDYDDGYNIDLEDDMSNF